MRSAVLVLAVVLVACGGPGRGDDGPPDGDYSTRARVIVTAGVRPVPGVAVVFHAADGTVTDRQVTDAAGEASAPVGLGSQVTLVLVGDDVVSITTFRGVSPGDTIRRRVQGSALATASVALPGAFAGGAQTYWVLVGEGNGGASPTMPAMVYVLPAAVSDPGETFVAYGFAVGSNSEPVAWSRAEASVAAPTVTLPPWSTAFDFVPFSSTGATDVFANVYLVDGGAAYSFTMPFQSMTYLPQSSPTAVGVSAVAPSFDGATKYLDIRSQNVPAAWDLDFAASPAAASNLNLSGSGARPTITWIRGAGAPDATRVAVGWSSNGGQNTWQIYDGELATSSIQLPELPADLGGPTSTTTFAYYGVEVIESDAVADYAAVLAGGLSDGGESTDRVFRSTVVSEQVF